MGSRTVGVENSSGRDRADSRAGCHCSYTHPCMQVCTENVRALARGPL